VQGAGGAPLLIPLGLPAGALEHLAARLDGLLLPGGVDVEPRRYGAVPSPKLGKVSPEQDETELFLARWALTHDLPLLAICRGIQMLNVAAGGTLIQDIASERPASLKHDRFYPAHPLDELAHEVAIVPGSRLAAILGAPSLAVNTRHHQALDRLGAGLVISARAPDGLIEGVEAPAQRFAIAVQWHPENLLQAQPAMRRLFRAFIAAAGG
jgi:putative glutamine amidotransferase